MPQKTSLDLAFIGAMRQVKAMKAQLHALLMTARRPDTFPMIYEGFRDVRKARRAFIAKYRELKAEEATLSEDDPRRQ